MQIRGKVLASAALAAAVVLGAGTAVVAAQSGDDDPNEPPEAPIAGGDLDRASAAALEHTGGGRVTETESGDEESAYEVEVTLDDGTEVDVQLDESFNVVGEERDGPDDD